MFERKSKEVAGLLFLGTTFFLLPSIAVGFLYGGWVESVVAALLNIAFLVLIYLREDKKKVLNEPDTA